MASALPDVALHGVDARSLERCALIRDWLGDLGVERATLLVGAASDLHPLDPRSVRLARWLEERRDAGDAVADERVGASGHRIDLHPGIGRRRVRAVERLLT
jgi:hypothetical protein